VNGEVGSIDARSAIFNHILASHLSPGLSHSGCIYDDVTVTVKVIKKEIRCAVILVLNSNGLVTQHSCDEICGTYLDK
jgi:hypothetical protein